MDSVLGHFLLRNDDIYGDINESLSHSLSAPRAIHGPTSLVYPPDIIVVRLRVHTLFRPHCSSLYVAVHTLAFHYLAHRSAYSRQGKPHKNRRSALTKASSGFIRQHVVRNVSFQVSVFRFQDLAPQLSDIRNLTPGT